MAPLLTVYDSDADETVVLAVGHHAVLRRVQVNSIDATDYFIHFFDAATAGAVTLGATVPKFTVLAERGDATVRKNTTNEYLDGGIAFQLGIVYAVKTVATTAGTTGPTTDLPLTIVYS